MYLLNMLFGRYIKGSEIRQKSKIKLQRASESRLTYDTCSENKQYKEHKRAPNLIKTSLYRE